MKYSLKTNIDYLNCLKAFDVNKHGLLTIILISPSRYLFLQKFLEDFLVVTRPLKGEDIHIYITGNLLVESDLILTETFIKNNSQYKIQKVSTQEIHERH